MPEIRREELESQPPAEENPEPVLEQKIEAEMPDDFIEPKGKSGKWSEPVKGEVEVEGKKVEVFYREKVIELPKHRQEETGIKFIRRRELLPPFLETFYIPGKSFYGPYKQYGDRHQDYSSGYSFDKKFDNAYNFLTDNIYPSSDTLVHVVNYRIGEKDLKETEKDQKMVKQFKKEGLYFQKIRHVYRPALYFAYGKEPYVDKFITPVFIFGQKNKNFINYLQAVGESLSVFKNVFKSGAGTHTHIPFAKDSSAPELRWCHAECALVPTKKSLNVLFFETGEEEKKEKIKK